MNLKWLGTGLFAAVVVAAGIGLGGCERSAEETPDVILLQSGRIRGNVYPRELQGIAPLQHYPYLAGYVKQVREEAARTGARVVLVDLGDSFGGSFASHATGSENMVEFFNALSYDAVVLGNLDNNMMPETLAKLDPVVLNPFAAPGGEPATAGTQFGARLDGRGVPVELLANFYGDVSVSDFPDRFPTWFGTTAEGVMPVRDYGPVVESLGERPDGALTVLTWMKFESPDNPPTEFLQRLEEAGVDAVLAHRIYSGRERDVWSESTFYDWKPPVSENILRNNGAFTLARLDLKRDGNAWRVLKQELIPMTANTAPADPEISEKIAAFAGRIQEADKPLGELPEAADEDDILTAYLTALTQVPGTEVAAYSKQSIRSEWPSGPLNASRVFNSLPWTTDVVQVELDAEQLAALAAIRGIVFLKKAGLPGDRPVRVTTSRFFASVLAEQAGISPGAFIATEYPSEFDFFVGYLSGAPKPLNFAVPDGWVFEDPRG